MARGRPRKFNEKRVLSEAAQLFRERGYDATSSQALSSAMGMGEQSIYNAFGNKQQVFQRALEQYCAESELDLQMLTSPDASLDAIKEFFSIVVDVVSSGEPVCLVAQTCIRYNEVDELTARKAAKHMRKIEKSFLNAIKNAADKGELHCDDPMTVARFLTMTMQGLGVLGSSGSSKKSLRAVANMSLQVLQ